MPRKRRLPHVPHFNYYPKPASRPNGPKPLTAAERRKERVKSSASRASGQMLLN